MKKLISLVAFILIGGFGWYLLSPLWIDEEVQEDFPLQIPQVNESMLALSEQEMMEWAGKLTDEEKIGAEKQMLELLAKQEDKVMEEEMLFHGDPSNPSQTNEEGFLGGEDARPILVSSGNFADADNFHKGSGEAGIFHLLDGVHLLRLENFSVTNGPDLRVYLTKSPNPTKEEVKNGLELEKLKGNKGNQNYILPTGINPEEYGAVVIYCKPFGVIFSVANLGEA